ncbi:type VI secretion system membrane subunit TssM [Luteibacter jiangsuensis]
MKAMLRKPWVPAAAGVVLASLVVWFGGPYLGIGTSQPLATAAARAGLIVIVALATVCVFLARRTVAMRRGRQFGDDLAREDMRDGERDARIRHEREQLRKRFADALAALRKRRADGGTLENLPWYLILGSPGSGKSTLLENSGLDFPLMHGDGGKRTVGGVGGTRLCDWWFTDQAVFLDTAGRFTTQDSDPRADAQAWAGFLDLLRRYRRRRPVNGVLLAVSVPELLGMDNTEREQHARRLRERLDEIGERLGLAVPVYVVLTKMDLAAGFSAFFDDLDALGRAQVWGTTFRARESVEGTAPGVVSAAFEGLIERVDLRMAGRIHHERDLRRRAQILSFPQQLRAVSEVVSPFVRHVFSRHAYGRSPVLRGVYLTSGTQEGTPIDRVLAVVSRSFGLRSETPPPERRPARTYFVERLLKETVLPEAGFVGADPSALRRQRLYEVAALGAVAAACAALTVGMATSYGRNADLLTRIDAIVRGFPDTAAHPDDLRAYYGQALSRLDVVARADKAVADVRRERPLSMRFGLFQADALGEQVRDAYVREINASAVPGVAMQFRDGVRTAAGDPQHLYDALKGYLMLGEPAHRNPEELLLLIGERLRTVLPADDALDVAMEDHLRILFDGGDHLRALPLDASLVDAARASLRAADLATLVYGNVKLANGTGDGAIRLDRTLGLLGDVFRRKSGAPLSRPLPALYTRAAFARITGGNGGGSIGTAVDRFVSEDWVLGTRPADLPQRPALIERVRELYVNDYIHAWDELIGDLEIEPVANVQQASGVASRLAGPGSPLKALLALVRDNTTHLVQAGSPPFDAPIAEHFASLDQLTEGPAGGTPLDRITADLAQVSKALLSVNPASGSVTDPSILAARQEASRLPPPLDAWIGGLVGSSQSLAQTSATDALGQAFRQAAGNDCAAIVGGRYPFSPESGNDVPLQDFATLFAPNGRFDRFFRQSLENSVDTSAATWTLRGDAGRRQRVPMLADAQAADTIRQIYFRDGPQPDVGFTISASPQTLSRLTVEVDGQVFEYKAGETVAPVAMHWPGPKPGLTRISAWDATGRALPVLVYPGPWGLFHALDAAALQRRTDTRFGATFNFGDARAVVDIEAASVRNPFGDSSVRRFRCPA